MSGSGSPLRDRVRASTLWPMLWKEFVQMRRDRLTLAMMLGIPAVQLLLFGFAIRTDVRNLPTVVLDESRSAESRALVQVLENTGNFAIVGRVTDRAALGREIQSGRARAAIVVPPDYDRRIKLRRGASAQVIVDAADPMASSAAISGAALASASRLDAAARSRRPELDVRIRPWYNPGLRTAVYIVPGIIGVLLSLTMVTVTGMAVVRERERGTLEQLVVTPVGKTSLVLGKILPFVVVGYVQAAVVLLLGRVVFHVPMHGSILLLAVISFAFILASLGLGLLISTLARTQTQAMQVGLFYLLPNILLSGFMFPREAMPAPAQWIGAALPLTYYLRVLRGILLRGGGLEALWPDAAALFLFALVLITLSARRFSKSID